MENCYVLFVKTGFEEKIVHNLKKKLDSSLFLPFVPKKEKDFRKNGKLHKEYDICFYGYTFIESELCPDEFMIEFAPYIRMFDDIYRTVCYGDRRDIAMRRNEIASLKNLYGVNYCIQSSVGFIEGDIVRASSGSLVGCESIIKKINRHKREAIIEIQLMGSLRQVTVGLEIVEKI